MRPLDAPDLLLIVAVVVAYLLIEAVVSFVRGGGER